MDKWDLLENLVKQVAIASHRVVSRKSSRHPLSNWIPAALLTNDNQIFADKIVALYLFQIYKVMQVYLKLFVTLFT